MVYYDVKPLGDLIKEFYAQHKGPDYMDEIRAVNSWAEVVGPFVAAHTIDISIKNIWIKRTIIPFTSSRNYVSVSEDSNHLFAFTNC